MKKITFDNLPAGSIILAKHYSLWQRFKAWLKGKELQYNDAWIDLFGGSIFSFKDSFWKRWDVFTFTPIKKYNKAEGIKMFKLVLSDMSLDPV